MLIYDDYLKPFLMDLLAQFKTIADFKNKALIHQAYIVLIIIFAIAILPMPYTFYGVVRTISVLVFGVFVIAFRQKNEDYTSVSMLSLFGLMAVYNPIFPLNLGFQFIWTIVNIATLYWLFTLKEKLEDKADISVDEDDLDG